MQGELYFQNAQSLRIPSFLVCKLGIILASSPIGICQKEVSETSDSPSIAFTPAIVSLSGTLLESWMFWLQPDPSNHRSDVMVARVTKRGRSLLQTCGIILTSGWDQEETAGIWPAPQATELLLHQ